METENTNKGRTKSRLHSAIFITGLVSLFTDLSSEMIVPILPLFLSSVLHVQISTIGLIEGIAEATASILKLFSGWLADRMGRSKPLMIVGYGFSNLVKPLFALSSSWGQVLTVRFADRLGKGVRGAPRDALLANITTKENRGKAFGFRRAMDSLGAALGPLVAFYILTLYQGNYRAVFWAAAIPGIIATMILIFFLKEDKKVAAPNKKRTLPQIRFKHLGRPFFWYTLVSTLFTLSNFSDAFLILRAQSIGMATAFIPLAYLTYNLVSTLFSVPAGILSDRIGRRPVIVTGYLIFALIYLGFGFVNQVSLIWVLFILYGLYYAATEGIQRAYVADLVPDGQKGTAMGTFNAITGFAALPASLLAGFLWQSFGPLTAFGVSSFLAILSALFMLVFRI